MIVENIDHQSSNRRFLHRGRRDTVTPSSPKPTAAKAVVEGLYGRLFPRSLERCYASVSTGIHSGPAFGREFFVNCLGNPVRPQRICFHLDPGISVVLAEIRRMVVVRADACSESDQSA